VDDRVATEQIARLAALKASRDAEAVRRALAALRTAAAGTVNLLPLILEAVKVYATIGEICDTLRDVFGEHQETVVL
jgi:methylmalonyl-CoA mutase N-terminal domain/subunit